MRLLLYFKKIIWVRKLIAFSRKIHFFGNKNISVYELISLYYNGLQKASLNTKAAAISWNLFLGLFPFTLFFLVLLQVMPHYEFIQQYIVEQLIARLMPENLIAPSREYFNARLLQVSAESKNIFAVLSFSMLIYLYYASNGINALINGLYSFNLAQDKKRNVFKQYFVALMLTLFLAVLMLSVLTILYYTEVIWKLMAEYSLLQDYNLSVIRVLKFFFFVLIFFLGVSVLYYKGPKNSLQYKEVIPGATLTTILFLITMYALGFLVSNFERYNVLYGSVGTIMILMITIYTDVILILIGYELNIAIKRANMENGKTLD